jgi:hypothetical protein
MVTIPGEVVARVVVTTGAEVLLLKVILLSNMYHLLIFWVLLLEDEYEVLVLKVVRKQIRVKIK